MAEGSHDPGDMTHSVSVDTEIDNDRTVITVRGTREAAVIVNSESGERVYLPPERPDEDEEDGPYRPAEENSPYEGIGEQTPYGSSQIREASVGVNQTANGFRVIHPEPASDVRFLR